jgi:hypothetical protein
MAGKGCKETATNSVVASGVGVVDGGHESFYFGCAHVGKASWMD